MDERINETYRKICAELLRIIVLGCSLSCAVKILFLNQDFYSCITEYLIFVGSPIYLAVRSRMLGVTQVGYVKRKGRKTLLLSCICALITFIIVYSLTAIKKEASLDGAEIGVSAFSFAISFLGLQLLYRHLETKHQEKLDKQYGDD